MADLTPEQQEVMDLQSHFPFDKYRHIVGFCTSCNRPMRRKDFPADLWEGDPKAVTAARNDMCAACATRGGKPPTQPHKRTRSSEIRTAKPLNEPVQTNRSGGFVVPLLGSIRVSRAESASVVASAERRFGLSGAVEIAEILGIRQ